MAPPNYYTSSVLSSEELKSFFRDYKLKVITDDFSFKISELALEKNKQSLDFILSKFSDDIISGSLALEIFGLISRQINDIDILIKDSKRFSHYMKSGYDNEFSPKNRLGFLKLTYKSGFFSSRKTFEVDFFHNTYDAKFIEIDYCGKKLKIHHPIEVMSFKMDMIKKSNRKNSLKHAEDLTQIFGQAPWQLVLKGEIEL